MSWQKRVSEWLFSPRADGVRERAARSLDAVGPGLTIHGRPELDSQGSLRLGAQVTLDSRFAPTRLRVGPGATLTVGDRCLIASGCVLSADSNVELGNGVELGPYVFAVDANVGDPDLGTKDSRARPIAIGDGVRVESRATILKGSRIGNGASIRAGSVVASAIPPRAVAAGNPASVVELAPPLSLHDPLFSRVWEHPERIALVCDDERVSYAALWRRAEAIANVLADSGTRTPVLFMAVSKHEFVAALYACSLANRIAVPVPDGAAHATVLDMAEACGAKTLLADQESLAQVSLATGAAGIEVFRFDRITSGPAGMPRETAREGRQSSDPALILFTSGTTARKKAVLLSHASLLQATRNINAFMKPKAEIREFVSVPLYHSFGLGRVRAVLSAGGSLVLASGGLNPAGMVHAIEREGATALSAVPAAFGLFAGKLESALRRIGPKIELIELGSAFMTEQAKASLLELFPNARVCMHYGLTEASRSTFLEFRSERAKLGSVGRASPNVVIRVLDGNLDECPPGVEGEIVIHGAHAMSGYFDDAERTREAFTADGGFRSGDYGFLDGDGYLHLVGRKDEMINKAGIKISPLELEAKIKELYPELDFCVVGVPDPHGMAGDVPVVAYSGETRLELARLVEELTQKVERSKLPDAVVHVDSIPRTDNGKPMRRVLREDILSKRPPGKTSETNRTN